MSESNKSSRAGYAAFGSRGEDSHLAGLLQSIGLHSNVSNVIAAMAQTEWVDSGLLQKKCGLRQPEVSVAVRELESREILEMRQERNGGRGRPRHMYRLRGGFEQAIEPFVVDAEARLSKLDSAIQQLGVMTDFRR